VGVVVKDKFVGKNVEEWKKACTKYDNSFEEVDVSAALASCLAIKDDEEGVK
jgi:nucleosome binding factor SPN SPT16 subunit